MRELLFFIVWYSPLYTDCIQCCTVAEQGQKVPASALGVVKSRPWALHNIFSVQCAVCSVQCAVCSLQCAVCSVQCVVSVVYWAVCSVQCAACNISRFLVGVQSSVMVQAIQTAKQRRSEVGTSGKHGLWQQTQTGITQSLLLVQLEFKLYDWFNRVHLDWLKKP